MISIRNFKAICILCCIIFNSCETCLSEDSDVYVPLGSDVRDKFTWNIVKQVFKDQETNALISPFSVRVIVALLAEATGGNTKIELTRALEVINSKDDISGVHKKLLTSLREKAPNTTLNLETKMFVNEFINPCPSYIETLQNYFDTDIERLDFRNAQASANHINNWCKNVTNGKLENLVTDENIKNSAILLANAIYFNGFWRYPFENVFKDQFTKACGDKSDVRYMFVSKELYYYADRSVNASILRLPYVGEKFSMFIVLPNKYDGLANLIEVLDNDRFRWMQSNMTKLKVDVSLPKFKFEYKKDLKNTLENMGIKDIFTDAAVFEGFSDNELRVSNIFQKAGIDVNEKGSEAFAASIAELDDRMGGGNPIFKVDHPFIFLIKEEATGSIIFAGKVLEPLQI